MSLTEFDQEEYDRNRFEEGKLEGFIETAKKLLKMGLEPAKIIQATGLSAEQLSKLANA